MSRPSDRDIERLAIGSWWWVTINSEDMGGVEVPVMILGWTSSWELEVEGYDGQLYTVSWTELSPRPIAVQEVLEEFAGGAVDEQRRIADLAHEEWNRMMTRSREVTSEGSAVDLE